jgi:Nucleotidyltransferase domain
LTYISARDAETTNRHLQRIKQALEKDIEGSIELGLGGSIKKHTYVDGLSDVDVLVTLNRSELAEMSPEEAQTYIATRLKESLPGTDVTVGKLAVTVNFSDGTSIQLLPSISTATGVRIANEEGTEWSNVAKPHLFAKKLTDVNQRNAGKVVPVVKLFKAINSTRPKEERLHSYHIEALAANAFSDYNGPYTHKEMLEHLTDYSTKAVLRHTEDETGQSRNVDEYLGSESSQERQRVSQSLDRLSKRMKAADDEASVEEWEDILNGA